MACIKRVSACINSVSLSPLYPRVMHAHHGVKHA